MTRQLSINTKLLQRRVVFQVLSPRRLRRHQHSLSLFLKAACRHPRLAPQDVRAYQAQDDDDALKGTKDMPCKHCQGDSCARRFRMIEAMSKWSVLVVSPYIVCPIVCVPLSTSSSELVKRHGVFQEAFRWLSIVTPLALRCQGVSRLGTAF